MSGNVIAFNTTEQTLLFDLTYSFSLRTLFSMKNKSYWSRAIILVDMNAFFASVEQLDNPTLQKKPVVVTNGEKGSCIITASYEARAYGVKTGMRLHEAIKRCPELIRCPSRPQRYIEVSKKIMEALECVTPDLEIFSIDEAFLDVTRCQSLYGDPIKIAQLAKATVWEALQLPCSVGLSGDKTTAKYAAKRKKPNGLTVILPWEAKATLSKVPVTELCGISYGIGNFLKKYGVIYCGDIEKIPIGILAKRFGNLGRRIWYMCQGADPDPVNTQQNPAKTMGHGKVLPPLTHDEALILTYFQHMSEKVAARLRRHQACAQLFFIGFKQFDRSWAGQKCKVTYPTNDGQTIYVLAKKVFALYWHRHTTVLQVQITALDPHPRMLQGDLFEQIDSEQQARHEIIDKINQRFGELKLAPARLLKKSEMPNVIGPCQKE